MRRSKLDGRDFDVIVCGGGSAGMAAACSAAQAGARTLLLEKLGFCGGTPVAAMIHTLDAIRSCEDTSLVVVGGYARDFMAEVTGMGGLATHDNPDEALSLHPEFMIEPEPYFLQLFGDSGLEAGKTYYYKVFAEHWAGNRQPVSPVASATTPAY